MYPKTISIEITNNCNNQCLICPHGHNLLNKKGYMTEELFYMILSKLQHLSGKVTLELHGIGEPLLHSNLFEFSTEASKRGFDLAICTNAILLNKTMARGLYKSGINKVVVSLETKENYEKIRCTNIYDNVLENVNRFAESYPEIDMEIYMIYTDQEEEASFDEFKEQFNNKNITFNLFKATDWRGKIPFEGLASKSGTYIRKTGCPLFEHYCSIDFNGAVRHCYLDFNSEYIYGNLYASEFDQIWFSSERTSVIKRMNQGRYDEILPCTTCVFPYTESDEEGEDLNIGSHDLVRPEMQLLSKIKQDKRSINANKR